MIRTFSVRTWLRLVLVGLAGLLVACGSVGSDDDVADPVITGSVVAAPVSGASVEVKNDGGTTVVGPVTTAGDGAYSMTIPNSDLSGVLIFESTGGDYTDEATGLGVINAGMLAAYIAGGSLATGSTVHLTPTSTIVHHMVTNHGMSLAAAQSAFASAFGFADDTSIAPADATNPAGGETQAELLAGLRAAAFSQLNMDLGLLRGEQVDHLLVGLARDIAHGGFDGQDAGGVVVMTDSQSTPLPADIQNRFNMAMLNFHGGAYDATGLANNEIGILPFAKVALSDLADGSPGQYKVEYLPGMMAAMEGKTMFKLRISNIIGGAAVTGLTPSMTPMMYMTNDMGMNMEHSSPSDGCTDIGGGDYSCTMYYLMASTMMMNNMPMSMGYWQLEIMANGESAMFYPQVMMDMDMANTHKKVVLKGQSDMIPVMGMPDEHRPYYLFRNSLSGTTGSHTFNLYLAAKEGMMSYPGVDGSTTLTGGTAGDLIITTMIVEVSSNASTWVAATDNGNGHWSATGITGLTDTVMGALHVRVIINGEQKTGDGTAPDGSANDYASFVVTPGV